MIIDGLKMNNAYSSIREYGGHVEPNENGPVVVYKFTEEGRMKYNDLDSSGLSLSDILKSMWEKSDFTVEVVKMEEFRRKYQSPNGDHEETGMRPLQPPKTIHRWNNRVIKSKK